MATIHSNIKEVNMVNATSASLEFRVSDYVYYAANHYDSNNNIISKAVVANFQMVFAYEAEEKASSKVKATAEYKFTNLDTGYTVKRSIEDYVYINEAFSSWFCANSQLELPLPIGLNGKANYSYEATVKILSVNIKNPEDDSMTHKFTGTFTYDFPQYDATYRLLSATNFTDEQNPVITFNKNYNLPASFTTNLHAQIIADNTVLVSKTVEDKTAGSFTFNLVEADKAALRNAVEEGTSRSIEFRLKSVIFTKAITDTLYSEPITKTFTIANALPQAAFSVVDTDPATVALTGDNKKFIKYHSNAAYNLNATASKGATITAIEVSNGNQKSAKAEDTIADIESNTFNFVATDSRKNAVSGSAYVEMVDYIKLTCQQKIELELSGAASTGAQGVLTISGNYYKGSFGAANNELIIETRQTDNNGNWGEWVALTDFVEVEYTNGGYNLSVGVSGLDYAKEYTFQSRAIDKLATAQTEEYKTRITPIFDWGGEDFNFNVPVNINAEALNMNGETVLRHNKAANNIVLSATGGNIYLRPNGTEDTNNETIFYGSGNIQFGGAVDMGESFTINGNTLEDFVIESGEEPMGSNGTWYWQKWASGKAYCWGCRNFGNMAITTAWGGLYRSAILTQDLPEDLFKTTPDVININIVNSNFGGWICKHENLAPSAITTGSFIYVRPASATASPTYIGFDVKGFWK